MTEQSLAAIIVAAGTGVRTGFGTPKQYVPLGGRAVIAHSHSALRQDPRIGEVVVVIGAGQEETARAALRPVTADPVLIAGGETRRESVMAGLRHIERASRASHVLIHDAARPLIPPGVIDGLIAALNTHDAAVPALPLADTLVRDADGAMGDAVERDGLWRIQTPQAFRLDTILRAHRAVPADARATDDAGLLRALGVDVALVPGDPMLEKLTWPADFARAEALATARMSPRTGTGFDVHRLVADKPLWLCGVEIPHSRGLSGHSDADVAIHALVDAILGALAEGDIGSHFPPSDPQWKGAASSAFLTFARDRVSARGGKITHVDVTIICEAPKVGPYREAMRQRLAELLQIGIGRISVKATTTERLGFMGRGEGIAAQAAATIVLAEDL